MNKILATAVFLLMNVMGFSQNEPMAGPQMADSFRQDGKIYVVIGVISIVFLCIITFLIYLERKMKQLEAEIKNK